MNAEFFIARRLFFDKSKQQQLSARIIRIALFSVALGLEVMIVSVAVITGFKSEIKNKVTGFGSHIQIVSYGAQNTFEIPPVSANQPFFDKLKQLETVTSIHAFATKPGIIKTEETTQGIIFKGVDSGFNWWFFKQNLIEGEIPEFSDSTRTNSFLISDNLSKKLRLKTGDKAVLYFVRENEFNPRLLQLQVAGVYRTNLEEFDNLFVIGDLKQVQRLNDWRPDQVGGFELMVADLNQIEEINQQVRDLVVSYSENESDLLRTETVTRQYQAIFDWLSVLDMNVWVILSLMTLVAGFNMISALLVLILERSTMIGILKAIGTTNTKIRKVFLYLAFLITVRGLFWGNITGIMIIVLQKTLGIVKLNPATYYVDVVPVNFSIAHLLMINIATISLIILMLIVPSFLVSKISPEKTIRFD